VPRERTLLVRRGGLGDTLLMLPLLRALRRAQPAAELHVAGVLEFATVLAHFGAADAALSSEDVGAWLGGAGERLCAYAAIFADDPRWLAAADHGPRVAVFDPRPTDGRPLPLQIAARLGLVLDWPADVVLAGWSPPSAAAPVVLAPGSGGRAKCWPREHWLALAQRLAASALPIAVLVGPVEAERDDPRRWPWPEPMGFVAEPDLRVVADRLRAARAFVGNDSGTTHLAAMLGVPTLALFGASDAAVFAPTGPLATVVQAPRGELPALPVDVVQAALRAALHGSAARTRSQ
jgi:heptosyltransferase-3